MNQLTIHQRLRQELIKHSSTIKLPSFQAQAAYFSNVKLQNANTLRALRKGKPLPTKLDSIDYRYRADLGVEEKNNKSMSIPELWGDDAIGAEEERQSMKQSMDISSRAPTSSLDKQVHSPRPAFVSFFDEVDAKMGLNKKFNKITTTPSRSRSRRDDGRHDNDNDDGQQQNNTLNRLFDVFQDKAKPSSKPNSSEHAPPRSIFDAFPLKPHNPNAYEKQSFEQYRGVMEEILQSEKFGRKQTKRPIPDEVLLPVINWLLKDERTLNYEYSVLKDAEKNGITMTTVEDPSESGEKKSNMQKAFRSEISTAGTQAHTFYTQLKEQHEGFVGKVEFTPEQEEIAGRAFSTLASQCARNAKTVPLSIAWEKMKEAGMIPSNDTLNVCLFVTGTMATSGFLSSALNRSLSKLGGRKKLSTVMSILGNDEDKGEGKDEDEEDAVDFPTELALFHDLLYIPTEKSITLRVKRLVSIGDASGAEELLDSFPVSQFC